MCKIKYSKYSYNYCAFGFCIVQLYTQHPNAYPQCDLILACDIQWAVLSGWCSIQPVIAAVSSPLCFNSSTIHVSGEQRLVQAASPNGYWQIFNLAVNHMWQLTATSCLRQCCHSLVKPYRKELDNRIWKYSKYLLKKK